MWIPCLRALLRLWMTAPSVFRSTMRMKNGQAAEPVEKELNLMVTEEMETEFDPSLTMDPELMEPEKPSFFEAYKMWILMGGAAAAGAVGFVTVRHIRKKRRAAKEKEDIEDEIS